VNEAMSVTPSEPKPTQNYDRTGSNREPGLKLSDSREPKKRGLIWLIILILIVAVVGYAVWRVNQPQAPAANAATGRGGAGRGQGRGAGAGGPSPVTVATVGRANVPVILNGLGNVTAFYTDTVTSRVDGQVMKVDFNEGDLVKSGQTLFEIDPRPYQVTLEQTQGALAHDQAVLNEAQIDYQRYQTAYARNAIAKQQLDDQEQLVAQDQGTVKQDQANVDNAKLSLTFASVTAPITGVAGLRLVDPGNMVHGASGTGLVVITQLQPISVIFTIPEDSLPPVVQKLRSGKHLPVEAYNRDDSQKIASGSLITLDNQIDSTTGTSKLKAVFDNKDNALFPQQFVNIHLLVDTLQNQIVVPNVAVQNGQQGSFVYVVDDGSKVHLRTVQTGVITDKITDILSGLSDGDRVVIDGTDRLVEGATVRVRRPGDDDSGGAGGGGGRGRGGRGARGGNGGGGGAPGTAGGGSGSGPAADATGVGASSPADATAPNGHRGGNATDGQSSSAPGNDGGRGGPGGHRGRGQHHQQQAGADQ
jgi:multidrug efflux system membrane fusion protein